jgi:hypothetical protein
MCPDCVPRGVVCLQYADDTMLFLEKSCRIATNMKWILTCFEQISGMIINYHKSELIPINVDLEECSPFLETFGCVLGSFPIKYIGIPLHYDKLRRKDLQPLIDSLLGRLFGWRGKLLSSVAKRELVRSVLASIPIYLPSSFKFLKWDLKLINTQLANCLWNDEEGNNKIHLANWPSVCMRIFFGGLGIPNLQDLNICLLGSWVKRYVQGERTLWRKVIDSKYNTRNPNILCCHDAHPSTFWKGVMGAAEAVRFGYKWKTENGRSFRFREDIWFGNTNLAT